MQVLLAWACTGSRSQLGDTYFVTFLKTLEAGRKGGDRHAKSFGVTESELAVRSTRHVPAYLSTAHWSVVVRM